MPWALTAFDKRLTLLINCLKIDIMASIVVVAIKSIIRCASSEKEHIPPTQCCFPLLLPKALFIILTAQCS